MKHKLLLRPDRHRTLPPTFSWVDHRLIRDKHIQRCRPPALALYLVLLTVADKDGVSYYADRTLGAMLRLSNSELAAARTELIQAELIAYHSPLYQVLSLDPQAATPQQAVPRPALSEQPATEEQVARIVADYKQRKRPST